MDWTEPSNQTLIALASLAVHIEEYFETRNERTPESVESATADISSIQGMLATVKPWLDSMPDVLKPMKRADR